MLLRSIVASNRPAAFVRPKLLQHRKLNVHEYCGMEIMSKYGVPVPENKLCKVS